MSRSRLQLRPEDGKGPEYLRRRCEGEFVGPVGAEIGADVTHAMERPRPIIPHTPESANHILLSRGMGRWNLFSSRVDNMPVRVCQPKPI